MRKLIPLIICALLLLSSCGETDSEKTDIVATMFPQYCFAKEVAGERANVEMLLDFGVDAHSYEPTPADIIKISKADLFIYTGEEMELWAKTVLESADIKKAIDNGSLHILDLSEHVELLCFGHEHEHEEHEEYDTHIWTSTENAEKMCEAISAALCKIDQGSAEVYTANFENSKNKFSEISNAMTEIMASATHDTVYFGGSFAFRYLFDEIGLRHVSIYEGCSSHAEPSAADIAKMVDEIRQSGAKYVLYDTASEEKIAMSIAEECGIEVLHLHAIHNITKAEFEAGEDYFSLMKKNMETLRKALS